MEMVLIKENEDGSADYTMHFEEGEVAAFVRIAVVDALKKAVEEGDKLKPYKGVDVE